MGPIYLVSIGARWDLRRHKRPLSPRFPFHFFTHLIFARFIVERKLAHSLIRRNLLVAQVSWSYFLISGYTFSSRNRYNKLFLLTKKCPHLIGIFQFNLIVRMLILSDIWLGALFNLNLSCHLSSRSGFHLIIPLLAKLCSGLW